MAIQHLFAFSKNVDGAAVVAGSVYGCGALKHGHEHHGSTCYYGGADVEKTIPYVHRHFENGLIDDPRNLRTTPVVVFNGRNDWEVYDEAGHDVVQQLHSFVDQSKLDIRLHTMASHVWSIDHGGCRCGACAIRGQGLCCNVNNCHYDLSGDMFQHFYGSLEPRVAATQRYTWIQQGRYVPPKTHSWTKPFVERWAAVYVPSGCKGKIHSCRVHVHYHGCIKNQWQKRRLWINNLDLNEYGEANGIVILYPQARGSHATGKGCWNWGFPQNDVYFDTKRSVQLLMVQNIVDDLSNAVKHGTELSWHEDPPHEDDEQNVSESTTAEQAVTEGLMV